MTTNYLSPIFNEQSFDSSGNPLVSGQVATYISGTSTPLVTYTTQNGTTPQPNPIILNTRGETTNPIWLAAGKLYKFILSDSFGNVLRTFDNIAGVNDTSITVSEWNASGFTPTYVSAVSFSVVGDRTSTFSVGRRIRSINSGGTIYSTISASSYNSGTGLNTVTVINDSSVLDAGLSAVDYAILNAVNPSLPNSKAARDSLGFGASTDVASAATVNLSNLFGRIVRITGTVATTAVTLSNGDSVWCLAVGAWPLTYNVTTMPLPGGASYTCTAGDIVKFTKDGSGALAVEIYAKNWYAKNLLGGDAGQIPYQSAANTTAMLAAGISGQLLKTNGASAPTWINLTTYTSTTATLPAAGSAISIAHGLGAIPTDCWIEIICTTADNGYSIGDVIVNPFQWDGTYSIPIPVWKSATNVGFNTVAGRSIALPIKTSASGVATATAASWSYRIGMNAL